MVFIVPGAWAPLAPLLATALIALDSETTMWGEAFAQ